MSSRWQLSLAALLILAPSTVADAAILIEARTQRASLRMVIDAEQQRALIATCSARLHRDFEKQRPGGSAPCLVWRSKARCAGTASR